MFDKLASVAAVTLALGLVSGHAAAEDYDNDGMPSSIPAPGSKPPTVAEWDGVTREVTVKGSTALHCETKMLREWLRVTCYPFEKVSLKGVKKVSDMGQQSFVGMFGTKASVVVQVVRSKTFTARFTWSNGTKDLSVKWPNGTRPIFVLS